MPTNYFRGPLCPSGVERRNTIGCSRKPEMLMEPLTDPDQPDNIDGDVIAQDMGLKRWGSGSSNVMRRKDKMDRILRNLGWTYVPKRGPGGGSSFIKTESAVLKTRAWNGQLGAQAAAG